MIPPGGFCVLCAVCGEPSPQVADTSKLQYHGWTERTTKQGPVVTTEFICPKHPRTP
jgi:hypothetical protein